MYIYIYCVCICKHMYMYIQDYIGILQCTRWMYLLNIQAHNNRTHITAQIRTGQNVYFPVHIETNKQR